MSAARLRWALARGFRGDCDLQADLVAVCKKSTPPVQRNVRAGEAGRVLEQGEGVRNGGQQLVVHGAARRTVD